MEAGSTIPSPLEDDDEDVHWALSTASALWARGERSESLKWLRRAAETASDANADQRALDLFKAAAEVAQRIGTLPPPPTSASGPPPHVASVPPATQASAPPHVASRPPPVPSAPPPGVHVVHRSGGPPPPPPRRVSAALKQTATLASPVAAPLPPPPPSSQRAVPPSRPSEPMPPPLVAREPRSVGPRSSSVGSAPPPVRGGHAATLPTGVSSPVAHLQAPPAPPPPGSARGPGGDTPHPGVARPTPPTRSSSGSSRDGRSAGQVSTASLDFGPDHASTPSSRTGGSAGAPSSGGRGQGAPHSAAAPTVHARQTPSSERHHHTGSPSSRERAPDSQRARTRTRPQLERRVDDEVTIQRDISSLGLRFDDLDEDTKIIPGRQQLGRVLLAVDPFRSDPPPPSSDAEAEADEGIADHLTTPGEEMPHGFDGLRAAWPSVAQPPQHEGVPSTMSTMHLATLPSLRVAVLGTSEQGDVRIMPLAPGSAAPQGAATAILVPLGQEDGEVIARLFEPPKAKR